MVEPGWDGGHTVADETAEATLRKGTEVHHYQLQRQCHTLPIRIQTTAQLLRNECRAALLIHSNMTVCLLLIQLGLTDTRCCHIFVRWRATGLIL